MVARWILRARSRLCRSVGALQRDQQGQGLAEYALILSLIVLAVVGTLRVFGTEVAALYSDFLARMPSI